VWTCCGRRVVLAWLHCPLPEDIAELDVRIAQRLEQTRVRDRTAIDRVEPDRAREREHGFALLDAVLEQVTRTVRLERELRFRRRDTRSLADVEREYILAATTATVAARHLLRDAL
jgi:hypothetical protein